MKMTKENISSGATFEGAISFIGLLIFVMGVFLLFVPQGLILGIFVLLAGLLLFLQLKGVMIDFESRRVMPYSNLLVYKVGSWTPLDKFSHIGINPISQNVQLNSRSRSRSVHIKHYDVYLIDDESEQSMFLYSFDKLPQADQFCREYAKKLNLKVKELPKIAPHPRDRARQASIS
jgi:hypothetical protein